MRALEEDLDKYPFQDYSPERTFVIRDGRIVRMDDAMLKEMLCLGLGAEKYFGLKGTENYQYLTLTSRGCPNQCAYCCNNCYRKLYEGKGRWLRTRSIVHVIRELSSFVEGHDYVNFISFFDDDFCARPTAYIREFFDAYDAKVGLPFKCNVGLYGLNEEKLKRLHDSGLASVEIGIQSGSPRTHKEVYKRPFDSKKCMQGIRMLAKYPELIKYYDVILDNPYETEEDVSKTIKFIAGMPKPFHLSYFSLTFFPGTELYERAVADGLVQAHGFKGISDKKNNKLYLENAYQKSLVIASGKTNPAFKSVYDLAAHPALLKAFSRPLPDAFFKRVLGTLINMRN